MALRLVFMGTPEFAVPSLKALMDAGHEIVGVITAPDRLGGRGRKQVIESAVKKFAVQHGLYVMQPKNLKNEQFVEALRKLKADLQVVVAFRMLPEVVWDMPPLGTMNLHGSLLPAYRGAAPINWAIINGEKQTGVTTFLLKHEIDTGDLILQRAIDITYEDTAGSLHDRMMEVGAGVVAESVAKIESGDYDAIPQEDHLATKAPKVFHENCEIDFDNQGENVRDFIRGLSPYPGAWTTFDELEMKIYAAQFIKDDHNFPAATMKTDNRKYIHFAVRDGFISPTDVKLQGRKRMSISDFLNGYKFVDTE